MYSKKSNEFLFYYESSIAQLLLDYEYNNILRKCNIINNEWNSSWEYEMLDEKTKSATFTISSSYLVESKLNQNIDFEIITKMDNTNMVGCQKQIITLKT